MEIKREYVRCTNCVMDTSDSMIVFDENGVCDWCNDFKNNILPAWQKDASNPNLLAETAAANHITKTALICIGGFLGDKYDRSRLYDPTFTHMFREASE